MTEIKQFDLWIANLNPGIGTEAGKVRPVIVVQTDLLNKDHPSTIICPITTNVQQGSEILRIHLKKGSYKLQEDCDIMIDQIRAIDNKRLVKKIAEANKSAKNEIKKSLRIILDLDS